MHKAFSLPEIFFSRTGFTIHLTPGAGFLTYPEPTMALSFVLGLPAFCATR